MYIAAYKACQEDEFLNQALVRYIVMLNIDHCTVFSWLSLFETCRSFVRGTSSTY